MSEFLRDLNETKLDWIRRVDDSAVGSIAIHDYAPSPIVVEVVGGYVWTVHTLFSVIFRMHHPGDKSA